MKLAFDPNVTSVFPIDNNSVVLLFFRAYHKTGSLQFPINLASIALRIRLRRIIMVSTDTTRGL